MSLIEIPLIAPVVLKIAKLKVPVVSMAMGEDVALIEIAVLLVESILIFDPLRVSELVISVPELQEAYREFARIRESEKNLEYFTPPP